jgi:hypothetical protein
VGPGGSWPDQPYDDRDYHKREDHRNAGLQVHRGDLTGLCLKNAGTPYLSDKTVEGRTMTGRSHLPSGEPRKASQKRAPWQDKAGLFHRDLGNGNAEVTIANRAYRVRIGELRPGSNQGATTRAGSACRKATNFSRRATSRVSS